MIFFLNLTQCQCLNPCSDHKDSLTTCVMDLTLSIWLHSFAQVKYVYFQILFCRKREEWSSLMTH